MDHFEHPRKYWVRIEPNRNGNDANPKCGDIFWIYLDVMKIRHPVTVQNPLAAGAVATNNMATELVREEQSGRLAVTNKASQRALTGLPAC